MEPLNWTFFVVTPNHFSGIFILTVALQHWLIVIIFCGGALLFLSQMGFDTDSLEYHFPKISGRTAILMNCSHFSSSYEFFVKINSLHQHSSQQNRISTVPALDSGMSV